MRDINTRILPLMINFWRGRGSQGFLSSAVGREVLGELRF